MELSGYTLPNNFVAVLLQALDELMGTNGLKTLLNTAGLSEWIKTPPANNDERGVDFSHFSVLTRTLVDLYGQKGSQSLMRPASNKVFDLLWSDGVLFDFTKESDFTSLDANTRIEQGLNALTQAFNETSDIVSHVNMYESGVRFILDRCPYCWDASGDSTMCSAFIGLLESASRKVAPDTSLTIQEIECKCSGDEMCIFDIKLQA
jgi:predicted hydrocarbon binding protein